VEDHVWDVGAGDLLFCAARPRTASKTPRRTSASGSCSTGRRSPQRHDADPSLPSLSSRKARSDCPGSTFTARAE
jgi:hypothetical protein